MSKRKTGSKWFSIKTKHGSAEIEATRLADGSSQLFCFDPPRGGAGIFVVYERGYPKHLQSADMAQLLEKGPHDEHQDLCGQSAGLVAGSGTKLCVRVHVEKSQEAVNATAQL